MSDQTAITEHDRAFELLPWLVNGTLRGAEREVVELHVRSCIICRREIKDLQRFAAAVRSQPTDGISLQERLQDLDRRLDANNRPDAPGGYAAFVRFSVVAVMGVALLGLLLWLRPTPPNRDDTYATLATTQTIERRAQVDLIFEDEATALEITSLLDEIGAEIVSGPEAFGRFGVHLSRGGTDDEIGNLLARLNKDPRVRFAGRSFIETAR